MALAAFWPRVRSLCILILNNVHRIPLAPFQVPRKSNVGLRFRGSDRENIRVTVDESDHHALMPVYVTA